LDNFLEGLLKNANRLLEEGYYSSCDHIYWRRLSIKERLDNFDRIPIIAEVKPTSPSAGELIRERDMLSVAKEMAGGGAVALSILTEPKFFNGSLSEFSRIRKELSIPLLMKDILIDRAQVDAAFKVGADAILLIAEAFSDQLTLRDLVSYSHQLGMEVLVEANSIDAFGVALHSGADLLGVNNRDLKTLKLDMETSRRIASAFDIRKRRVICESGISSRNQVLELTKLGYVGFLVGTSILNAQSITEFLTELSRP